MKNGGLKVAEVAEELRKQRGNMAAVARVFKVSRQAVHKFVAGNDSLREVAAECRESMKDDAENALVEAVLRGEAWAVCFFLKCQAKDRGYVERLEVQATDGDDLDGEIDRNLAELERAQKNGAAEAHPPPPLGARPLPPDGRRRAAP